VLGLGGDRGVEWRHFWKEIFSPPATDCGEEEEEEDGRPSLLALGHGDRGGEVRILGWILTPG
jgi:hypothetical protein